MSETTPSAQTTETETERTKRASQINIYVLNAILAIAWTLITGNLTLLNLVIGFALAYVALWLPRSLWGESKYFRRGRLILRLIWVFLYELAASGFKVALMVFNPRMNFRSGILAIPLESQRDLDITLFANLISLTPGTLSIDVSDDRSTLYVHSMHIENAPAEKQDMKQAFEKNIGEALR